MVPSIVIIDDLPMNLDILDHVLRSEGFRTWTAQDGRAGIEICRAEKPDLILLDVMLPNLSGFETCALLKSDPVTADIPVIFVSALDDVKSKVRGLKIGGVDFLSKPVHAEEVLARVRVHLRIGETNRELARRQREQIEEFRDAQQAILLDPADCPEASFGVFYKPLAEVGGDFYDVVSLDPDMFGYFVADVSGHGVKAAFLTSAIKALLRQFTGPLFSPEDTLRGIDSVIRQLLGEEQYLTACHAQLNFKTGRLSVASAGHPPVITVSTTGVANVLELEGDPLGIFNSLVIRRKDITVRPGDRVYLYTDGLIESSPGAPRAQGLSKLIDACVAHRHAPVSEAPARIAADILRDGRRVEDDLLLLAVEVKA